MAFTNPILSGEELNRTGIKSENYVPGDAGWRIASNGAAEFDNVGLRGNLWVPTITLGGQDLGTRLNNMPKGIIAFITGYPVVATTSEQRFMLVDFNIARGRYYEVYLTNITADQGNAGAIEYHLRWTFGTNAAIPTVSSDQVANSLRLSQFQLPVIRFTFWSGETTLMRIAAFITSLDGAQVRTWAPGAGCHLGVLDHGIAPYDHPGQGTVGTGIIPKTLREWTITANSSKTYNGDGTLRTDQYATTLVSGDWQNGRGNQRAWCTFSTADQAKIDELIGVPLADIEVAELKIHPFQYKSFTNDGWLSIGLHPVKNSLTNQEPGGGVPNIYRPYVIDDMLYTIGLKPPVTTTFLDSMRDGYMKGFMFGNTFSGDGYANVCQGVGGWSDPPKLHMRYWKAG